MYYCVTNYNRLSEMHDCMYIVLSGQQYCDRLLWPMPPIHSGKLVSVQLRYQAYCLMSTGKEWQ